MQQRQFRSGSRQAPDPFDQFLEQHNFYRKHTARDASCLFRVISEQMYDTQMHHLYIRNKCVTYIRKNRSRFEKFIEVNFDEYLAEMLKPKTFGTLLELQAAGCAFQRNILLFEPYDLGNYFDDYNPMYTKVFRVFYTPEKHFDSVFTSEYIEEAAICQSICYEILYGDLYKLPDISFAVEQMLHNTAFDDISYEVEEGDNADGNTKRLIMSDGRTFELDRPENTNCILENYKLCHFHYEDFPTFSSDLQRQLRLSHDDVEKNTSLLRTTAALLPDKHISCVRQLLLAGITPFPYKVAKALDSSIYRNIEFDVWNEMRKELKWSSWYNGGFDFKVGAKCHVQLCKSDHTLYTCHIQDIIMEKGLCTVFIEQLGERRVVSYESLKPLPPHQFKPWCLPYRYQKQVHAKYNAAQAANAANSKSLRACTLKQNNNYRLKLNKTNNYNNSNNNIINATNNNKNNDYIKSNLNPNPTIMTENSVENHCNEILGKQRNYCHVSNELDHHYQSQSHQFTYNQQQQFYTAEKHELLKYPPEFRFPPCDVYGGAFIYGSCASAQSAYYSASGTVQGNGLIMQPYDLMSAEMEPLSFGPVSMYNLKEFIHLENFQRSQSLEYCTMPLQIDYSGRNETIHQHNGNINNHHLLQEQPMALQPSGVVRDSEESSINHDNNNNIDVPIAPALRGERIGSGNSTTQVEMEGGEAKTTDVSNSSNTAVAPVAGSNNEYVDFYVQQQTLSSTTINEATGLLDSYVYQHNPYFNNSYQFMDRDYNYNFNGAGSLYPITPSVPTDMMPLYTLPVNPMGVSATDEYYFYDGTNSMSAATGGIAMIPMTMGSAISPTENGATMGGVPALFAPYVPAYIPNAGLPAGTARPLCYVYGNNSVGGNGGSNILLPTVGSTQSSTATSVFPSHLTHPTLFNSMSQPYYGALPFMSNDGNNSGAIAATSDGEHQQQRNNLHQQYYQQYQQQQPLYPQQEEQPQLQNSRESVATNSEEGAATTLSTTSSSSSLYSSKLPKTNSKSSKSMTKPLVADANQQDLQSQYPQRAQDQQQQTLDSDNDITTVNGDSNLSEMVLNHNNNNHGRNEQINNSNHGVIILANRKFEVKKSYNENGCDLPTNISTLRYFYNLGVDYYTKCLKDTQKPDLAIVPLVSTTMSSSSSSSTSSSSTSNTYQQHRNSTAVATATSTAHTSTTSKPEVKATTIKERLGGNSISSISHHQQSAGAAMLSTAAGSARAGGYRATMANPPTQSYRPQYRFLKNSDGRYHSNTAAIPNGDNYRPVATYSSRKSNKDFIAPPKHYNNTHYSNLTTNTNQYNHQYLNQPNQNYLRNQTQYQNHQPYFAAGGTQRSHSGLIPMAYPSTAQFANSKHQMPPNFNSTQHYHQQQQQQQTPNYQQQVDAQLSVDGGGRGNGMRLTNANSVDHTITSSVQTNTTVNGGGASGGLLVEASNTNGSFNNSFVPLMPQPLMSFQMAPMYGCFQQPLQPALLQPPPNQHLYPTCMPSAPTNYQTSVEVAPQQRRNSNKMVYDTTSTALTNQSGNKNVTSAAKTNSGDGKCVANKHQEALQEPNEGSTLRECSNISVQVVHTIASSNSGSSNLINGGNQSGILNIPNAESSTIAQQSTYMVNAKSLNGRKQ